MLVYKCQMVQVSGHVGAYMSNGTRILCKLRMRAIFEFIEQIVVIWKFIYIINYIRYSYNKSID